MTARRHGCRWLIAAGVAMGVVGGAAAPGALAADSGAITAGEENSCAVVSDGTPACWGDDVQQQNDIPTGIGPVTAISTGEGSSCAIQTDGTPVCWGQYGTGSPPSGVTVKAISIALLGSHGCAVETDGAPTCWGSDSRGELDIPRSIATVRAISAGEDFTCALTSNGAPRCWGYDNSQQTEVPPTLTRAAAIAAGFNFACAIKPNGTPVCWGDDIFGESDAPAGIQVKAIAAGDAHACAIKTDGTPVCWGRGSGGVAPAGIKVTAITAGDGHSCAVKTDGTPVCWGSDFGGATDIPDGATPVGPPGLPIAQTIAGTRLVGQTLTADTSHWAGASSFSYTWQRCTSTSAGSCTTSQGPSSDATYALTSADFGQRIRVIVTATDTVGSTTRTSGETVPIGPKPHPLHRPTISGSSQPGGTLTATTGSWSHDPTGFTYTWQRCATTDTTSCATVQGPSTDNTYDLTGPDEGNNIRVIVTATNPAGSASEPSILTAIPT